MLAEVVGVKADGVIVRILDGPGEGEEAWLPKNEWSDVSEDWDTAYEALEVGQELDVLQLRPDGGLDRRATVSQKRFDRCFVDESWLNQPRVMKIDTVGRTLIRGEVSQVEAVMKVQDYLSFLEGKNVGPMSMDHAALGKGDLLGGIVTEICGEYGTVELDPNQYLALREQEVNEAFTKQREQEAEGIEEGVIDLPPRLSEDIAQKISPVLLVENNNSYRESIKALLERDGVQVHPAATLEEAEHLVSSSGTGEVGFRMAIIDLNLEEGDQDRHGLRFAGTMVRELGSPLLLITGEVPSESKRRQWGGPPSEQLHRETFHD